MMKALYKEEGASLRIEILENPDVLGFIGEHAGILDSAFGTAKLSDTMRRSLEDSDWMFSGFKAFHEMNEAFPSLLDEKGGRKPFERFLNDVLSIDNTYNRNYLNAEYNFAQASAEMAGRWESFDHGDDRYLLEYRTAGDDKVRPEHAAMNGIALPESDRFWDTYYPPNGWNCRCTVVQVRRKGRTPSNSEEAMRRGAACIGEKGKMFAFNPGKQQKVFPDYNPYTISRCSSCSKANLKLGAGIPDNEVCAVCARIHSIATKKAGLTSEDLTELRKVVKEWTSRHLPDTTLPNGQTAKRLTLQCDGDSLIVNRTFFTETLAKNIRNSRLSKTMEIAMQIEQWLPAAKQTRKEVGIHHKCDFLVYETKWNGVHIEVKVKDQGDRFVYTMRIKK